jgi:hypothetical protein
VPLPPGIAGPGAVPTPLPPVAPALPVAKVAPPPAAGADAVIADTVMDDALGAAVATAAPPPASAPRPRILLLLFSLVS